MASEQIKTSVNELMMALRNAIDSLIPTLERVKLVDRNLNGYDGWDSITETLFKAIVEDSILWSLESSQQNDFSLPKYGFSQEEYANQNYIRVIWAPTKHEHEALVFVDFQAEPSGNGKISHVKVLALSEEGKGLNQRSIPVSEVKFVCQYKFKQTNRILDEITIQN